MAKKAMINKEQTRRELAAKGKYPVVRLHNRCSICGRPHGFHRDFGICRICLRKMAHQGLLQFSCSVMSDFLQPHESQHARPPCPSPTPGVHSDRTAIWGRTFFSIIL